VYTKLFSSIVHSTIWRESSEVRVLWITMLAIADRDGFVWASLPGLADAARISIEACEHGLERLQQPDPYSRSQVADGRRIEPVSGGWRIINYAHYRDLRDPDARREQVRQAVARHRRKKDVIAGNQCNHGNHVQSSVTPSDTDTEADHIQQGPASSQVTTLPVLPGGGVSARADARAAATPADHRLTPEGNAALERLCRSAQHPDALLAEVRMILDGGRPGVPSDPAAVSLALHDMLLAGGRVTGAGLRAFVARAARGERGDRVDWDALIAKAAAEDAQAAAKAALEGQP